MLDHQKPWSHFSNSCSRAMFLNLWQQIWGISSQHSLEICIHRWETLFQIQDGLINFIKLIQGSHVYFQSCGSCRKISYSWVGHDDIAKVRAIYQLAFSSIWVATVVNQGIKDIELLKSPHGSIDGEQTGWMGGNANRNCWTENLS